MAKDDTASEEDTRSYYPASDGNGDDIPQFEPGGSDSDEDRRIPMTIAKAKLHPRLLDERFKQVMR
jgi:hypothetical protein